MQGSFPRGTLKTSRVAVPISLSKEGFGYVKECLRLFIQG
jgi:hypothetical protein